ncbi:hypothetical protein PV327_002921 [Microctonus hyperodae]|uniref:Uncharacterized protein n=1 Tax=Microctonus hyperodae TaxID=165561 RepID=A0AA39G386_MICHY|nr:hypothetical protein PV327_002921 [Microctonus hyperodae]
MVSSCCGCTSLKKGVLIITILQLVLSIINLATGFFQHQGLTIALSNFISIMVASIAIRGTVNEKAHLIFPLVSAYFVGLFMLLPVKFIEMIQHANQVSAPRSAYAMIILCTIIGFGIGVYFLIVTYSFYQELLRKKFSPSKSDNTANV